MKKFVTYEEKELKQTLVWLEDRAMHITSNAIMMTEQYEGKRSNLDWSIGYEIISDINKIKDTLKSFKINTDA